MATMTVAAHTPLPALPALSGEVPTRTDGSLYRYELVYAGHTHRTYADTPIELVEALIEGYETMNEQARWEARLLYAIRVQVLVQAELNLAESFASLPLDVQTILQGPRHDPPVVPRWAHPVPLVLVASFYAPAALIPRPVRDQGMAPNVLWIDPSDDDSLLASLHDLGVVSVYTSDQQH